MAGEDARAGRARSMVVVAAAIIEAGRLLVVSKRDAPRVFYLPGGKPEPGETAEQTLRRELAVTAIRTDRLLAPDARAC